MASSSTPRCAADAPTALKTPVATTKNRKKPNVPLLGASAALGVVAGGLYGGAWAANAGYHDAVEERDNDRAISRHGLTNGLSIGSVVAGSGAAASRFPFASDPRRSWTSRCIRAGAWQP